MRRGQFSLEGLGARAKFDRKRLTQVEGSVVFLEMLPG